MLFSRPAAGPAQRIPQLTQTWAALGQNIAVVGDVVVLLCIIAVIVGTASSFSSFLYIGDSLRAHIGDFNVVVGSDGADGDKEPADIDGCEGVVKDEGGGADGDYLFEDAGDAERDDRGALQESKFGRGHKEGEDTWKEEDGRAPEGALLFDKGVETLKQWAESFDGNCKDK